MNVEARFAAPKVRGHLRLWAGMMLANRPWRLFPSFKGVVVAAFATGTYAMIFTTIWQMSDLFGWARLSAFAILSMAAMIQTTIAAHGLWERSTERITRKWPRCTTG